MLLLTTFLRDDPGTPLGAGMPSGRPLRLDGERHYDAWLRLARQDPCAYCGGPGGTVDHVEPRSRPVRGIGGTPHAWVNVVGACAACNGAKRDRPLLRFLLARRRPAAGDRRRPTRPMGIATRRAAVGAVDSS